MPDPIRCCILGICCAPNSAEQKDALAHYLENAIEEFSGTLQQKISHAAEKLLADFKFKVKV